MKGAASADASSLRMAADLGARSTLDLDALLDHSLTPRLMGLRRHPCSGSGFSSGCPIAAGACCCWRLPRPSSPRPRRASRCLPIGPRPSWAAPRKFLAQFFPLFLLGALFGKLMDDSGSVETIARFMTEKLGTRVRSSR